MYNCGYCERELETKVSRAQHEEDCHIDVKECICNCGKWFSKTSSLMQHLVNAHGFDDHEVEDDDNDDGEEHLFDYHGGDQYRNLRQYLRMVIKRMSVSNEDRRISRQHVQSVFEELSSCMQNVEKCIFSKNIRKSGSYSTDTKIYVADEFDFDIPLKDSWSKDLLIYEKQSSGYAEITFRENRNKILPSVIQHLLYRNLSCAVNELKNVEIDPKPHGPAINLKIYQPKSHDINVDLSPSIKTNHIGLIDYGWPRGNTKRAFPPELIKSVTNAGLHLVPKKPTCWYVSISLAGKTLMNEVDQQDDGCRKTCHKLLKADFQEWLYQTNNEISEVSTFVLKHQLFWLIERSCNKDWTMNSMPERYLDMLEDFSWRLRSGVINNYFRHKENILKGKNQNTLNRIANLAEKRRNQLLAMD